MPQDYYAYWLDEVREFSDKFETDDDKYFAEKVLLNSLGNLTILKNGKNSSLKKLLLECKKKNVSKLVLIMKLTLVKSLLGIRLKSIIEVQICLNF